MVATELGAEEQERLKHQFQKLDANGDGHLSSTEIGNAIKSLGLVVPDQAIQDMMHEADQNYNGLVQFDDFVALVHRFTPDDGTVWGALLAGKPDPNLQASKLTPDQIQVTLLFIDHPTPISGSTCFPLKKY